MAKKMKARLVPRRDKSDIGGLPSDPLAEAFASHTTTLCTDGTLRFERVRPDRYRLFVEAPGLDPTILALDVPAAGFNIGTVPLRVPTATGRIEGGVWHPKSKGGTPWAFAKGNIGSFVSEDPRDGNENNIAFQADENGRFKIDHVPVGLNTVAFPVPGLRCCQLLQMVGGSSSRAKRPWFKHLIPPSAASSLWPSMSETDHERSINREPV